MSVALLLTAGAKKKLLYFLLDAFEKKPKRYLMVCLIAIVEITQKLLTNWRFGVVLKNIVTYTKCVFITVANWKTKVLKLLLQIFGPWPL